MGEVANDMQGEVTVSIGGKELLLRYNAGAVRALENACDKASVIYIMRNYERFMTFEFLAKAVRAGIRYDNALTGRYTERWLLDHIDAHNLAEVGGQVCLGLARWYQSAQPQAEDGANDPLE